MNQIMKKHDDDKKHYYKLLDDTRMDQLINIKDGLTKTTLEHNKKHKIPTWYCACGSFTCKKELTT